MGHKNFQFNARVNRETHAMLHALARKRGISKAVLLQELTLDAFGRSLPKIAAAVRKYDAEKQSKRQAAG